MPIKRPRTNCVFGINGHLGRKKRTPSNVFISGTRRQTTDQRESWGKEHKKKGLREHIQVKAGSHATKDREKRDSIHQSRRRGGKRDKKNRPEGGHVFQGVSAGA